MSIAASIQIPQFCYGSLFTRVPLFERQCTARTLYGFIPEWTPSGHAKVNEDHAAVSLTAHVSEKQESVSPFTVISMPV